MGQMCDTTRDQTNIWMSDNLRAFRDQLDRSHPQTTRLWKVKYTSERFSWYGSDDARAKIEPPSCWQYKPGYFLAIRSLNWDQIIDNDDDDENWADHAAPSGGRSHPGDGNDNDDGEGEEDMQGGEKGTGEWNGTTDGTGNRNGMGKAIQ